MIVTQGESVYLDDAGHPVDKRFLVIGGFLAYESSWIAFEDSWKEILKLRQLDFPFHATDCFHDHAKDPKLKHVTGDLIRTIANHVRAAFSVGLDMEAYKTINRERRLEECAGSPISMISRVLRKNVELWQKMVGDASPIHYFIEEGTYQRGDMMDCWEFLDGVNPPIQIPKKHPAAQAADLYAYSVYQSAPFDSVSWQHQICSDTFDIKGVHHIDGKVMESDMRDSLARKTAVVNGVRIAIPERAATEGINFTFKGNKNKQQNIRRAKIGIAINDRTSGVQSGNGDNSSR